MKIISALMVVLCISISLSAKEKPHWVADYQKTGSLQNQNDYYFGIGSSEKSKKEADNIALVNFGMCIETKVKSEVKSYLKEKNGKVTEKDSNEIKISSDIGLKGISINERYSDGGTYYSLIKYNKVEYNKILEAEIKRDLERQQMELNKHIEENKLDEKEKQENIRNDIESQKIKDSVSRVKDSFMRNMRNKYPDFFDSKPPYKAVSFRNGELIPHKTQFNTKTGLFPISFEEVFLAYKVWLFEFSLTSAFYENKYNQQEIQVKYQILPYSGKFYKFSSAFGFTAYKSQLITSDFIDSDILFTPFIAGNITLPNLNFSYLSLYADLTKTGIAINNYVFYKQLKDRVSAILEVNWIYNDELKNRFEESIVFQPAIVFKTTDNLSTTFSYEENEFWILGVEIGF